MLSHSEIIANNFDKFVKENADKLAISWVNYCNYLFERDLVRAIDSNDIELIISLIKKLN